MTGNFHRNSDVDRLYVQRKKGGRGLKSIQIAYETRIISTRQHLRTNGKGNKYLENVTNHEQDKIMRVGEELLRSVGINDDHQLKPRAISQRYLQNILKTKQESYQNKQYGKYVYEKMRKKDNKEAKITYDSDEFIFSEGEVEYWWNVSVKTPANVRHNKPVLIVWKKNEKTCKVVEFSCPNDVNVTKKIQEKEDNYGPLLRAMQITYPEYRFSFVPIVVGALGTIPKELKTSIIKLGFNNDEAHIMIKFIQQKSILGSVKIVKTFLKFRTYFIFSNFTLFKSFLSRFTSQFRLICVQF